MKVLFFQQRGWGTKFGHYLAKMIQEEYKGSCFAALIFKRQTLDFFNQQTDINYEPMLFYDDVQNNPEKYLDYDISLEYICQQLGIDTVWPLMQSMRNYVRDYSKKYYYSYKQQVHDNEIRKLIKATFLVIKNVIDEFKPDIIISPNFVSLPHMMASLYARKKGIKMVAITDTKIRGVYIWVYDYYETEGRFFEIFYNAAENPNNIKPVHWRKAKEYLNTFRIDYIKPEYSEKKKTSFKLKNFTTIQGLKKFIISKKLLLMIALLIRGSKSDMKKIVTLDNRSRRLILRDYIADTYYTYRLNNWDFDKIEKGDKFAYFPMQFQPEASVDVIAPFFNNQIEVIRQIAMALPGDMTLIVKEHPAMLGKRPPGYLEKVQKMPNVKFVDYRIRSYDLIKQAKVVVTINSTSSIEAAFLGIPSVQLGNLGTTLLLPHVKQCTDMTKLSEVIRDIIKIDTKDSLYEDSLLRYIAASYEAGFETNYSQMWEHDAEGKVNSIWDSLKLELPLNIS